MPVTTQREAGRMNFAFSRGFSKRKFAFKQINLFTRKIQSAYLVAWTSPRKAFYRIWIEETDNEYSVVKESGIRGRVLDKRSWPFDSLEAAQKLFDQRIRSKTDPERKSPRIYTLIHRSED